MRRLVPTILCVAALLGVGGVTVLGPGAAAAEPASVNDFKLAYSRSGGIAGSFQSLAVRPGRRATVTTGRTPTDRTRAEFVLPAPRVRTLQQSLARADIGSVPPPGPSGCADCFLYDLRYDGHRVEREEVDVPRRLQPVLTQLDAIIDAHS